MEDRSLLLLLEGKPDQALEGILQKYGGLMHTVAYSILKNPQDTEECMADALVKLWKTRERLREPERLKSYLCAITRNAALDRRRKAEGCQELSLQQELTEDYTLSRELDEVLLAQVVTEAVDSLGEPCRTIFLRRYYQEERVKDIAQELGLTVRAVESHLFRGKKRLRELFTEGGLFHEAK